MNATERLLAENRKLRKNAERWEAFRMSNVTSIEFEDMACHTFRDPPMPTAIDDLGDFLIKHARNNNE